MSDRVLPSIGRSLQSEKRCLIGQLFFNLQLPHQKLFHLYLEIRKMFLHKTIDLADREAACFAVLQGHGDQTADMKIK